MESFCVLEQWGQGLSFGSLLDTGTHFIPGRDYRPVIDLFLLMALGAFGKGQWMWKWGGRSRSQQHIVLLPCTQWLCGPQINGKVMLLIIFGCKHSSKAKLYQVLMNKCGLCSHSLLLLEMASGSEVFQGYFWQLWVGHDDVSMPSHLHYICHDLLFMSFLI